MKTWDLSNLLIAEFLQAYAICDDRLLPYEMYYPTTSGEADETKSLECPEASEMLDCLLHSPWILRPRYKRLLLFRQRN